MTRPATSRWWRGCALWLAAVLVAVSCSTADTPADDAGGPRPSAVEGAPTIEGQPNEPVIPATIAPVDPGVIVWVHDREPIDLHADDPDNSLDLPYWLQQGLIEGLFGVDQNLVFQPELLAAEPTVEQLNSGTIVITYELRQGLQWSDGEPLTADDVAFTHEIIVEGCEVEGDRSIVDSTDEGCEYELVGRLGYELVTDFEVQSETTFKVTMASFFPGWREMYSRVFATHAYGDNATEVNANLRGWASGEATLPSSGPLLFEAWTPGDGMDFGPNPSYHGSASPDAVNLGAPTLAGLKLVFIADLEARIQLLAAGDAHLMVSALDPTLGLLTESEDVAVGWRSSPVYEHLSLNLLNPHLAKPEVRQALAAAIDKDALFAELYAPVFGPEAAGVLGNAFWMPTQPAYEDHQATYAGAGLDTAGDLLEAAEYTKGSDGVWRHRTDGRLELQAGTTGGDAFREKELELLRDQLDAAGFAIMIDNLPGGLFFTEGPFSPDALDASATGGTSGDPEVWDLALFSWISGPWPGAVAGFFRVGSSANPYGFNNPAFDVAATDCDALIDDADRDSCYGELDTYVTTLDNGDDGLILVPLAQKPRQLAFVPAVVEAVGVSPDSRLAGPLVNAGDFGVVGS